MNIEIIEHVITNLKLIGSFKKTLSIRQQVVGHLRMDRTHILLMEQSTMEQSTRTPHLSNNAKEKGLENMKNTLNKC